MSWIEAHKDSLRLALLVITVLAFLGPWTFDNDGVPPPEWCDPPLVLLENGSCAQLVRGMAVVIYAFWLFGGMLSGLLGGNISLVELGRGLLFLLALLLPLAPIASAVWLLRDGENRFRQAVYMLSWALAFTILMLAIPTGGLPAGSLWGLWLYRLLAVIAMVLEILVLAAQRQASLESPQVP